jgi:CRP-like cAMP-binding protein
MSDSPPPEPTNEPEILVEMVPSIDLSVAASSPDDIATCLTKVSLFADLPSVYLRRIAILGVEESYARGAPVFAEGTPGDKLYVILSGAVRISRQVPGMGEEALAILKAGDYFGEMALIDDFPRSADAIAHESCRLLVLTKERVADLLFVDRDLAYDLLWSFVRTLSARLRETNDKMTFLAVSSRF